MSSHSRFLSDEQFQCSICLDLFTNPSSTPCGHSFCLNCISRYWSSSKVCQCPLCKKTFQKRPDLQINRTLREITEQFKAMRRGGALLREKGEGAGGDGGMLDNVLEELKKRHQLFGEVTRETKVMDSLASSVPNHNLINDPSHVSKPPPPPPPISYSNSRRRFTLTGAASSQSLPVCVIHHRGILIYCKTDQVCICPECGAEDHPDHDTVNINDEWMKMKARLSLSEQQIQEMISQRIRKMDEIRTSVAEIKLHFFLGNVESLVTNNDYSVWGFN